MQAIDKRQTKRRTNSEYNDKVIPISNTRTHLYIVRTVYTLYPCPTHVQLSIMSKLNFDVGQIEIAPCPVPCAVCRVYN